MDFLKNLGGDMLKQQAVDKVVDMVFERFDLPESLSEPLKSTAGKLSMDQLGDLGNAFTSLREGKYQEAVSGFSGLISSFPKEGALYWLRGLAKNEQNASSEAKADLEQARNLETSELPDFSSITDYFK